MKTIGIFDAKTRLAEICDEVSRSRQPVTVTRRGEPLVRIDPIDAAPMTIKERREAYLAEHASQEPANERDFEIPARSRETATFDIGDEE